MATRPARPLVALLALVLLAGCEPDPGAGDPAQDPPRAAGGDEDALRPVDPAGAQHPSPPGPPTSGAPSPDEAAAATYAGIYGKPLTLSGGEHRTRSTQGRPAAVVSLDRGLHLTGDLDRDGDPEAAVVLRAGAGEGGEFVYLAVLDRRDGAVSNVSTSVIGRDVQVTGGRITGGEVVLELLQPGDGDGPQATTRRWRLDEGQLLETPAGVEGAAAPMDLEGAWRLTRLGWNEDAPAEPVVTLVVEGDRVSGNAGCNRYFGQVRTGETEGTLQIGPLGGTRKACPGEVMALENRYLTSLGEAQTYRFMVGQLVLSGADGDDDTILVFTRSADEPAG